ncbi:MAG: transcription antitermination factor NusB [Lachnospiraceae bacterium]|jgi:N utilization substance protein B|nr:transcription antitermination factor NusB [Lachnospiraceae bacterium]MBP5276444.1 transcription antitermination factor NusB [Lachnospiraceae bacterium]MBQ4275618.1 transcription antitermination factor NusB [Lachnospiraceae bacterium]MCR4696823.1 transcription antitermination factor NusB [Lachnospiraceae bacterium]
MNRKAERELTFKLLFMSDFYDKKELDDEVLLYFDAPFPFEATDGEEAEIKEEFSTLNETVKDADKEKITQKYVKILEKLVEIDEKIASVSKGWTLDRIGRVELAILRLATYEILFDDDVPASVAINEAVELAKKFGSEESYSFINGILANFA